MGSITRRRFLRDTAIGTGALVVPSVLGTRRAVAGRTSKVVRVRHHDATSGMSEVNQWPVDMVVHAAVRELTGIDETGAAWKSLFPGIDATKKVGIKINLACGDVPTHPEVVNAIIEGLLMMDLDGQRLPENHIIVWDADNAFFCEQTGYEVNYGGEGVQYFGTDHPEVGYDPNYTFTIEHPFNGDSQHHPSKIITQYIDYMINAAVIKDHSDAGVTLCLKNNYGSFDNIGINQMHQHWFYGDGHTRGEPELNRILRDELGNKTKLFLIDGTLGLYDGGPGYVPPYHTPPNWAFNSVLVSFDPVAIDRIGTMKINGERALHGLSPLDPSHVRVSAQDPYNLGTDDPDEIDLVEIDLSAQRVPDGAFGPRAVALLAPYPNPTSGSVIIRFHCKTATHLSVRIFDATGREVGQVASGEFGSGMHRLTWDLRSQGQGVGSGVYFVRLSAGTFEQVERIALVR